MLEEQQVPVLRRQPHQAQRRDGGQRGTSHHQEVRVAPLHFRRVHSLVSLIIQEQQPHN